MGFDLNNFGFNFEYNAESGESGASAVVNGV